MKKLFALVIICHTFFAFSQEKILEFKNSLKTSSSSIKDVTPIVNKENGDISIFIADAKNVYGYKFDKNYKLIDSLSSAKKKRKYKTIIGNSISKNGDYYIYLTNKNKRKILITKFSFETRKYTSSEFSIDPMNTFLQTVSFKNKFYLIYGNKTTKKLFIATSDDLGNLNKQKIDLTELSYVSKNDTSVSVLDLFINVDLFSNDKQVIQKIEEDTPNSVESAASNVKMYLREKDDSVIFTFDNHKKFTQLLLLNLHTLKASKKVFVKPLDQVKSSRKKTNSFLKGDKIFTIAGNKDICVVNITDYESGKLLKELVVTKDNEIDFKNSPIIQKGGTYSNYRELGSNKKFLRKISAHRIGISVIKQNNEQLVTIGGYSKNANAGAGMMMSMMGGVGGITLGSIGNATFFFNPTGLAFNSFYNTKSTRIECKFDNNFNHLEGEFPENAFDLIKYFSPKNITNEVVFKIGDSFIHGYYRISNKNFVLRKYSVEK